jgi:hypothetical protein
MFNIKAQTNIDDYIEYSKYYLKHSADGQQVIRGWKLALPYVSSIVLIITIILRPEFNLIMFMLCSFVVASIVWWLIAEPLCLNNVNKQIERLGKKQSLPYDSNMEITFEEDYVYVDSQYSESKFYYPVFERAVINGKYLYLFKSRALGFIIRIEDCQDQQEFNQLVDFLRKKIKVWDE